MATTPNSNPNQLSEKDLKRLIELLQKIDKLSEVAATNMANQAQSAGNATQQLNRLEKEWDSITGDISYASKGFSEILQDLKNSNEGLNESVKAYRGLKSIAETLQRYQQDISEVSEKDVAKQKQKLKTEKTRLVTANELLADKKKEGETSRTSLASDKARNEQEQKHLISVIVNLQNKAQKTKQEYYDLFKARKELQATSNEYTSINKKIENNEKSLTKIEDTLKQNEASIGKFDALAEGVEFTLQRITKEVKFKNIENLDEKLKNVVKETLSTDKNLSKINKSFNSLTSIAQKIQDYQSGSTELSEKEIKNLLEKSESEKKFLLSRNESLKKEQASLETEKISSDIKKNVLTNLKTSLEQQKASGAWDQKKEDRLIKIKTLYQKQSEISEELNEKLDLNDKTQKKISETITKQDGAYNELRSNLSKISKEIKIDLINNIDEGFKNIVEEVQSTDDSINKVKKSFSAITTIAQKIQDHQSGANELSEKDAKKLLEKLESEKRRLSNNYELLKLEEQRLKVDQESNKTSIDSTQQEIARLEALKSQGLLTSDQEKSLEALKIKHQTLLETQTKINDEIEINNVAQNKTSEIINKQNKAYNTTVDNLKKIKKEQENLRKAVGLSGLAVDGIGKAFSKLGLGGLASAMGLDEAKEKMAEVAKEITDGGKKAAGLGGQFRILIAGLKEVGASILKNLTDPVTIVTGLVAGLTAGIKGLISLFEQTAKFNGDIAKTFALSADESSKIGDNLRNAANSDFFMSNEESRKAFDAMANATGTINSAFSDGKTVSAMNDMMTYAGYTAESAGELYKLGQLNNKSADEMVTSLQGQLKVLQVNNKLRINEKQAVEMVAKASATVRMNLGANPKKLADAAFYASKLGMTLDEISSAAEQTLNFESAIQNQLEYQVLTGKEINIDAYQQAAASGDAAAASKELNRLLEEQGGNIEGNFFAQEALAKTLGISREQMMKSLELQKIQKKVGGDVAQIESAINRKMKEGLTFEQAAAEASKEGYQSMVDQNKNAEAFSRTISKIKEIFMNTIASSQGFKNLLSKENIDKFVDTIKTKVIPFVEKAGKLIGKLIDPDNIDKLVAKFKEIGAILKVAGTVIAGLAALKLAQGITNLIKGQRGSSRFNPLFVTETGGGMGGEDGMGMDRSGKPGKTMSRRQRNINRALKTGLGIAAAYTAYNALSGKNAKDFSQDEVQSYMQQTGIQDEGQAREQMASQQYQTGSKYGDLAVAGVEAASAASINTGKSVAATSPKPLAKNQKAAYQAARSQGVPAQQAMNQARNVKPEKGMLGKAFDFMSDMGSKAVNAISDATGITKAKDWFAKNIKSSLSPLIKSAKNTLRPVLKTLPFVGPALDLLFMGMNVNEIAKQQGMTSPEELYSQIGKAIIGSGAGMLGGTIAAAGVSSLQAVGIPGWLLSGAAYAGGSWLGNTIGSAISDYVGGPALGKAVMDTFYEDAPKSQPQQVKDGSLNPNGGPVVSVFQKGELKPVMQGIKEDNVYMTTNKPAQVEDGFFGRMFRNNSDSQVAAALDRFTAALNNSDKTLTIVMDGREVGKVLVPVMTKGLVENINKTAVLT